MNRVILLNYAPRSLFALLLCGVCVCEDNTEEATRLRLICIIEMRNAHRMSYMDAEQENETHTQIPPIWQFETILGHSLTLQY